MACGQAEQAATKPGTAAIVSEQRKLAAQPDTASTTMHLQQRQHGRLEQLWVTLLHEEVQLVARVVPQFGKLLGVAQHAPLRKEVELTPEVVLLSAIIHQVAVCLGAQDVYNSAPTAPLPGYIVHT